MVMMKRLDPSDINITPFKVYKQFTVTPADSGSGVYGFRGISGSARNFTKDNSIGVTSYPSASFHHMPTWFLINKMYYRQPSGGVKRSQTTINPFNNFGSNSEKQYRLLHESASLISVPRDLYGERIKPKSITLKDDSTAETVTVKDDGFGNLYDSSTTAHSASFASFASSSFANSETGSFVGNIFYDHGLLVITSTGSRYGDIGTGIDTDGYNLEYQAQKTIREHSYTCIIGEGEMNATTNISVTGGRSGSINVNSSESWKLFPPGDALYKSGSYKTQYEQATEFEPFVTHSFFAPYVTRVGLYNDFNDLIAVGQLSAPLRNDPELALGITVRFDV